MSLDRSLKSHGGLKGERSVMTRSERIAHMIEEGEFDPSQDSPFGLPKLRVQRSKVGTKSKKEETPEEEAPAEGAEGAEATEAAEE